jgi:co-chaperonin GroES (HSP10)
LLFRFYIALFWVSVGKYRGKILLSEQRSLTNVMSHLVNITDKFIVVGDRVLIKPKSVSERTKAGIYLPPGVQEKEKIQSGYIIKTGPGYPIGPPPESDEPWKERTNSAQYIPLQAQVGDLAIFLQNSAHELEYEEQRYIIVPNAAILLLIRDDDDLGYYLT